MFRDVDNPRHPSPSPDTGPIVRRILVIAIGVSIDLGCALWVGKYMGWIGRAAEGEDQVNAGSDAERGL
jgi:hypothetical protein